MLYHVVQLGLRRSLHKGVSQITPACAGTCSLRVIFKAKPHDLTLDEWGDHILCAQGKEQARSLVKPRGKPPTNPLVIKARYEY